MYLAIGMIVEIGHHLAQMKRIAVYLNWFVLLHK